MACSIVNFIIYTWQGTRRWHKTGSSCYQTTRYQETMIAVVRQTHWVIRIGQQPRTDPGDKHWQALLYSDLDVDFFFRGHTLKIDPYVPSYAVSNAHMKTPSSPLSVLLINTRQSNYFHFFPCPLEF